MNWIREFMLLLFLTTVTGSLLMLVWMAAVPLGMGKRNVHYAWWMLKSVLAGYLLPFVYLAIDRCIEISRNNYDILSVSNIRIDQVFFLLFIIWAAGIFVMQLTQCRMWICLRKIRKCSMPAPMGYVQVLQKLCAEMKLRKKVSLYQGYGVVSPFICGIRKPSIYLPVQDFSEEELEMILYHELMHYRQGDIVWKLLFGLVGNLYWFSPLSRYLWTQAVRWAEVNCDAYCCQGRFQIKEYFLLLLKMGGRGRNRLNAYVPMWTEGGCELEWRIQRMQENHRKKPCKMAIAVIIAGFILGGGISAHAGAEGIRAVYYGAYVNTVEKREINCQSGETEEEGIVSEESRLEEYMGYTGDDAKTYMIQQEETDSMDSANGTINWQLAPHTLRHTASFSVHAGRKIRVYIQGEFSTGTVQAGMIRPDGKISYVSGEDAISHTFRIAQTGNYKVFVSNEGDQPVAVKGSYFNPEFSLLFGETESRVSGDFQEITADTPVRIEIGNQCLNNPILVNYMAAVDSSDAVVKVEICKDSTLKNVVASSIFHRSQPHSAVFTLPADTTYYAKITPMGTGSVSGSFMAKY